MEQYSWAIVTFLLGLFASSFLKSYASKKAENLAMHEGIEKLVEQMSAIRQATKEIEAKISDDVWNRQRQSELKREAVFSVMLALNQANHEMFAVSTVLNVQKKSQNPDLR